jgi:hypothetical protein
VTPQEKYGAEFYCQPFTITKADGRKFNCHDVVVCISPMEDKESTLAFGWSVLRELAQWVCSAFETTPIEEEFRIIIAWSRNVRPQQGHIFKVFADRKHLKLASDCETYQDYARRYGDFFIPLPNWQKDVFK